MEYTILKLHSADNTAVASCPIPAGAAVSAQGVKYTVNEDIPKGHKVALENIPLGADIIKYGFSIGKASEPIPKGSRIHTHNLRTGLGEILNYTYTPEKNFSPRDLWGDALIQAYRRENGEIGIRNELWIIPLVGCINKLSLRIADIFKQRHDISHTDGIYVWEHPFGCSQLGDDLQYTQRLLSGIARHPNAGGVLLLGLGCENNTYESFLPFLEEAAGSKRIAFVSAQKSENEIDEACEKLALLAGQMKNDKREPCSFYELKIGLKCGGSDAFSGITANPLLGYFADAFTGKGGCVVMTEVPEMFGAETILMNRAQNKEVFKKITGLINDFKEYYQRNKQPVYENPSPGNKDGGISTLEDKSLGCTQKGGRVPVEGVLGYAQKLPRNSKNLWLLEGPGNDQIAVSNLGAAGVHMVLFTTGRGTPFGGFIPTVKVSTNTELAQKKPHWIDFDAGQVLNSGDFNALAKDFGQYIINTASGSLTNNEIYGSREIAVFKRGVVL